MKVEEVRGQGATEYLILLAVVLVVVTIVISLIGFYPGIGGEVKKAQSQNYWDSATPIRIEQSFLNSEVGADSVQSNLTLSIENKENSWIVLKSIEVDQGNYSEVYAYDGEYLGTADELNLTMTAGLRRVIVLVDESGAYTPPDGFEVGIEFGYESARGTPGEQRSPIDLIGDSQLTYEQMEEMGCVLLMGMFWWCP